MGPDQRVRRGGGVLLEESQFLQLRLTSMRMDSKNRDGWMTCDFKPFQQYSGHIRTIGG